MVETAKLLAMIRHVYPNFRAKDTAEETETTLLFWHRMLSDIDYSVAEKAFDHYAKHSTQKKYAPNHGDILDECECMRGAKPMMLRPVPVFPLEAHHE